MMRGLLVEWDVRSFHYALIPPIEGLIGDLRGSIYISPSFMEFTLIILFVCFVYMLNSQTYYSFLYGYYRDIGLEDYRGSRTRKEKSSFLIKPLSNNVIQLNIKII